MNSDNFIAWITGIILVLLIFVGIPFGVYKAKGTQRQVTFTVQDKIVKSVGSGNNTTQEYLIFTDKGIFKDTDSLLNWKFNSSDVYGQLQKGHKYDCRVFGYRFGFTSDYPDILKCTNA